jgi:hypothetical protein
MGPPNPPRHPPPYDKARYESNIRLKTFDRAAQSVRGQFAFYVAMSAMDFQNDDQFAQEMSDDLLPYDDFVGHRVFDRSIWGCGCYCIGRYGRCRCAERIQDDEGYLYFPEDFPQ